VGWVAIGGMAWSAVAMSLSAVTVL
jgi:hypothetical protein